MGEMLFCDVSDCALSHHHLTSRRSFWRHVASRDTRKGDNNRYTEMKSLTNN